MNKSNARLKFLGVTILGWLIALLINFTENEIVVFMLVVAFFASAIYLMLVRCEKCGTLLYRYDSTIHGLPHFKCMLFENKCPVCGVERT